MLQMEDYVAAFVLAFRNEADKLQESEKPVFREYAAEETLRKPCQIEIVEFRDPYRLVWVFFFDKNKSDLKMSSYRIHWKNLGVLVAEFGAKYPELRIDLNRMYRTFEYFRNISTDNLNYSMDVLKNVHLICFPHDVRLGAWPLSRALKGDSSLQAVAKIIFYVNCSRSRDRY